MAQGATNSARYSTPSKGRHSNPYADADRPRVFTLGDFRIVRQEAASKGENSDGTTTHILLKYLLSCPGHRASAEKLIDDLWPGTLLDRGREYLRRQVMHLRRSLEPRRPQYAASSYLVTERQGLVLRVANGVEDGLWVDAVCFENLATEALEALHPDHPSQVLAYKALGLYRGHFLDTDMYVDWIVAARRRYQRLWTALVSTLASFELGDAHFDKAILLLARLVDESPDDEGAVKALMVAYAASGRRAEALRTYRRLSVHLKAALEIEPGVDLKTLEQAIRAAQPLTEWMPRRSGRLLQMSSA